MLGCSFGVGFRVILRLKDKVKVLGLDQHLNAVWPHSVAEMNLIMKNRHTWKRKDRKGSSQRYWVVPEESLGNLPDVMPVVMHVELHVVPNVLPELTNDDIAS